MKIRKAGREEIQTILELFERGRHFMAEQGNPNQWGTAYPPRSVIEADIQSGNSYVCEEEGEIAATFFYRTGEDKTYSAIQDGEWLQNGPYGVVHRIVSAGTVKGAAGFCLEWALSRCGCLRIDTHRDNKAMQNLLKKQGFTYCGIIHVEDGSERLAYEKIKSL